MTPSFGQFLPRPPRDPRPEKARLAFEAGRFGEAAAMLESYVEGNPDNAEAWLFLGWSHYRLGDFEKARRGFEKSLEIDPDSPDALVGMGYSSLQSEGSEAAAQWFRRVLAKDPERGDALRGLVLAGRRPDAPASLIQEGHQAASMLESREGKDIEILLSSTTLEPGQEKRLRRNQAEGPIRVPYRAGVDYLEEAGPDGTWKPIFIKGVNLGTALPGRFAGEAPVREAPYREWLTAISELGANAVRIYTLLPPAFYAALEWHNSQPGARRIWLIQGVWTELPPKHDFSDVEYVRELKAEIARTIDVVHGNLALGPRRSHAWGTYDADVSEHLLAYVIGREWEPFAVQDYNEMYPLRTSWSGRWLTVDEARPMECWVAEMCDFAAGYEAERYRTLHPLTFANWPTLDPLHHPAEPTRLEEDRWKRQAGLPVPDHYDQRPWENDGVSLDSTLIRPTAEMEAGLFAAYHIYPNYPDFMNNEYGQHRDAEGTNRYAGYLRELKAYHGDQPVLVAEFGMSTSRGIAHVQPEGWHHGGISEPLQGEIVARLFTNIHEERYAGGVVFELLDEWFKGVWSVAPYEIPEERRNLWFNAENPEQAYGLFAVEPDSSPVVIDGNDEDWAEIAAYLND